MKQIRKRINDLIDQHGDTFPKCKKCPLCKEINGLTKKLERGPTDKFQRVLDKGQDMTRSDIDFLLESDISKSQIQSALKMHNKDFYNLMENFGLIRKRSEKEMAKLTLEEYQDLSAKGHMDKDIAKIKDMNHHYLSQLKKQWNIRPTLAPRAVKETAEGETTTDDKTAVYERVIASQVESEIATLREEKEKLDKLRIHNDYVIENQKYQLGKWAKENEELVEENKALRVIARRYLRVE